MGASVETFREELEQIKLEYPDMQGSEIAIRLLEPQDSYQLNTFLLQLKTFLKGTEMSFRKSTTAGLLLAWAYFCIPSVASGFQLAPPSRPASPKKKLSAPEVKRELVQEQIDTAQARIQSLQRKYRPEAGEAGLDKYLAECF